FVFEMSNEAFAGVGVGTLQPDLKVWEIVGWTDAQKSNMYTDWGIYFQNTGNLPASVKYLDKALEINPNDTDALRRRSNVKRRQSRAPAAVLDCITAKDIIKRAHPFGFDHKINLELSDALYESNRLEDGLCSLHLNRRLFSYTKGQAVNHRMINITQNIKDALSDVTAPAVYRVIDKMMNVQEVAKRHKKLKSECDVMSILEAEEEFLSPLEKSRRKRHYKIYNHRYLDKLWMDVGFLKEIRENSNLCIKEFVESSTHLKTLADDGYRIVRTFTKMLHTRSPMYCRNSIKGELHQKYQQENLFRIQYQTRRNMFKILRTIRSLIRTNKLQKLKNFVDDVMGNYVTIKTNRIMPWKFEFVNEVYNYLGLARINDYKIPSDMKILTGRQRLMILFKIPTELDFNRKGQFENLLNKRPSTVDPKSEKFKKQSARYEYRMRFAKYPIERSYLYHEYAQAHLDINSFDACCLLARKSIDGKHFEHSDFAVDLMSSNLNGAAEAVRGKNYIWAVLSALVACKAHTILGKVEKQKEMLTEAFKMAKKLKSIDLCLFIDICLKVNTEEIELKRQMMSSDSSIKRKMRRSSSFE
ncbi:hypothetical protein KR093_000391, partial [Drosophila rubida]